MSPENLERVKEVLDGALKVDPADRAGFVSQACGTDEGVRREVESLLAEVGHDTAFLDKPFYSLRPGPEDFLVPGQRIGPYEVVRELGEGGMGQVALAVREDDFNKLVALKLVRRDLASGEVVRRFENERQILAHLEHPNVARILDGGTTEDGRPYFVMEYVDGLPIDEYCDEKALSIRRRLELFLQVCSALQVAHQNLVVHRDLKPGNILVTEQGVPKLLDFGVAKHLAAANQLTGLFQPMTLAYASPEQIKGRPISTASDVYSLGVLLYQLLTGRSPYGEREPGDLSLSRAICDEEPRRPSTVVREAVADEVGRMQEADPRGLRRRLAGDLDSIVLKALQKEPSKRYGSVEQLSEDIRRHLQGRPVHARDGTFAYLAGKFIRRHKLPFAAVSAFLVLGIAFTIVATVLRQRSIYEHQRNKEIVGLIKRLFRNSRPDETRGKELTAHGLLERGEEWIKEQVEDPLYQTELLGTVAEVYVELGLFAEARRPRERAVEILRSRYPGGHLELATALNNLAALYSRTNHHEEAEELLQEALAMKRRLRKGDEDLTKIMNNLATALMYQNEFDEAERIYREALEIRRESFGPKDESVAISLRSLGNLYYVRGDFESAEALFQQSLDLRREIYDFDNTAVARAYASLGRAIQAQGRLEEAERLYEKAREIRLELLGYEHREVADSEIDLASLLLEQEKPEKETAAVLLTRSLATVYRSNQEDHWKVARAESLLGGLLTQEGRWETALPCLCESYCDLARIRGKHSVYALEARRRLDAFYETLKSSGPYLGPELRRCECDPGAALADSISAQPR